MILAVGDTSKSVDIMVVGDNLLPLTGKIASQFPAIFYSRMGANASIQITPLTDLSTLTSPFQTGGIKERSGGRYRLDIPDDIGSTEGRYSLWGDATNFHISCDTIEVSSEKALMQLVYNELVAVQLLLQGDNNAVSSGIGGLMDATQRKRNTQNYVVVKGEAYNLTQLMNPVTDITGWNIKYTLKKPDGTLITEKTVGNGIVIINAAGGAIKVMIAATLNELPPDEYDYDIWRLDSGFENQLSFGKVKVESRVRT